MGKKGKYVILAVVLLAVAAILLVPRLGGEKEEKKGGTEFAVTANPRQSLAKAKEEGRPVLLEFYAQW